MCSSCDSCDIGSGTDVRKKRKRRETRSHLSPNLRQTGGLHAVSLLSPSAIIHTTINITTTCARTQSHHALTILPRPAAHFLRSERTPMPPFSLATTARQSSACRTRHAEGDTMTTPRKTTITPQAAAHIPRALNRPPLLTFTPSRADRLDSKPAILSAWRLLAERAERASGGGRASSGRALDRHQTPPYSQPPRRLRLWGYAFRTTPLGPCSS